VVVSFGFFLFFIHVCEVHFLVWVLFHVMVSVCVLYLIPLSVCISACFRCHVQVATCTCTFCIVYKYHIHSTVAYGCTVSSLYFTVTTIHESMCSTSFLIRMPDIQVVGI
jgi:hypothetical protein